MLSVDFCMLQCKTLIQPNGTEDKLLERKNMGIAIYELFINKNYKLKYKSIIHFPLCV